MSQSTELTGGAGFVYESHVAAYFLSALLAESVRLPLQSRIRSVALQQAAMGAPLDDIVIELDTPTKMKAHFQVKRSLTISSADSNKDFANIITNSWKTYIASINNNRHDIYGALTDDISSSSLRVAQSVCENARSSESSEAFWALQAAASASHQSFIKILRCIFDSAQIQATPLDLYGFLKGFHIESLRIMIPSSPSASAAINELRLVLQAEHRATDLWESLKGIAREGAGQGATFNKRSLLHKLNLFAFKNSSTQPQKAEPETKKRLVAASHATPMSCALAVSHMGIEFTDVALTVLMLTDTPVELARAIKSWKERISRSALIPASNKIEITQKRLSEMLLQPALANFLLHDFAVADFYAYIYYARSNELTEWNERKYELELKAVPLFHRLSNKNNSIVEIYTALPRANQLLEDAITLVSANYHREVKAPSLKSCSENTLLILELADAIAQITAGFIAGDQIAASQIGYIKTRIRYAENVVTKEKHLRDCNPLA
ncbi:hypothetical protein [Stutzerimonas kunmingensis]|uniref:hypothetical protein n=1 Tax=Stutzerimonas kunmingensis TaxID=1211807 RepID=UPI00256DC0B2|nr:hypothetical protein [Stutzerimonas kunmingensis]WOF79263.1 hypothetical protein P5704_001795 [Pseudomonas sp. FeN3W]